jgi:hypothetical protein
VKRIVCLANSRKLSGRCIAGKEFVHGGDAEWVRPVSAREHEEVSEYERQYEDGTDPCVLDILDVPLLRQQARGYQSENWLLDPDPYWIKVGSLAWSGLARLVDPDEPLWVNGFHTHNGNNDKIPLDTIGSVRSSLRLLRVTSLQLLVCKPDEAFGSKKRRVQAQFQHERVEYHLWVTDPVYELAFLSKPDGVYSLGSCFLTVSVSERFHDAYYKLVAAIIQRTGASES